MTYDTALTPVWRMWLLVCMHTKDSRPRIWRSEDCITLKQAAGLFPSQPSYETVRRWCCTGVHSIVLESYLEGGLRMTSREAVDRFLVRINSQ